jgi:Uncharacterized protein conserved in bacteria (DUF2330)
MRRRLALALSGAALGTILVAGPALACGGLIGPNGAVNLLRTTTFAAYHAGVEHYITAFQFQGGGGAFGSITPLPGVPSAIEKGGDWTLQRLVRETSPQLESRDVAFATAAGAEEIMKVRIDALDVTVLKGGAADVGKWAADHGFRLPPDAPEVLEFYANRSPIFMAAVFDADAAAERGQAIGDGTPIHVSIPTPNPWVPIRVLALGKTGADRIEADVFLLTDVAPAFLPAPTGNNGMRLDHSSTATTSLLDDLRSDKGMAWVPSTGWLTKIAVDAEAAQLSYDLAIDATGQGMPSYIQAGFDAPQPITVFIESATWTRLVFAAIIGLGVLILVVAFVKPSAGRLTPQA